MDAEFQQVRSYVKKHITLSAFDKDKQLYLDCDASFEGGLGFILWQLGEDGKIHIILTGSTGLLPAQKNYSPFELELCGAAWSTKKCKRYLMGQKFTLRTDCAGLVGLESKDLEKISNPRELRLLEDMLAFNFDTVHIEGRKNIIADYLSRHPEDSMEAPHYERLIRPTLFSHPTTPDTRSVNMISSNKVVDMALHRLCSLGNEDLVYTALADFIMSKRPASSLPPNLHEYGSVLNLLSVEDHPGGRLVLLDGSRLVIPTNMRGELLAELHQYHQSLDQLVKSGTNRWFWPGLKSAITKIWEMCEVCQTNRPAKMHERPIQEISLEGLEPLSSLNLDNCQVGNHYYSVAVDRFSGLIWAKRIRDQSTAAVTSFLDGIFNVHGLPLEVRADNGSCYRKAFKDAMTALRIDVRSSAPYHPQGNGGAERGVGELKKYLSKNPQGLERMLLYLNSTESATPGLGSPYERFYGRLPRLALPCVNDLSLVDRRRLSIARQNAQSRVAKRLNRGNTEEFQTGDAVRVKDPHTKLWSVKGEILSPILGPDGVARTFSITCLDGTVMVRNASHIHHRTTLITEENAGQAISADTSQGGASPAPTAVAQDS